MPKRRSPIGSLKERCELQAEAILKEVRSLPPCSERERLELQARQLHITSQLEEWLAAPAVASQRDERGSISSGRCLSDSPD